MAEHDKSPSPIPTSMVVPGGFLITEQGVEGVNGGKCDSTSPPEVAAAPPPCPAFPVVHSVNIATREHNTAGGK